MGRYDMVAINSGINSCIEFLSMVNTDMFTRAFWLCSLWMLLAAKDSGTGIVNNRITSDMYNGAICMYRNSYAHNDSLLTLKENISELISTVTDDMLVYSEIESSVNELRKFVIEMEEI